MQHLIRPIHGPAAVHGVRRALVAILTTLVGAAACDQQSDKSPTSPSIADRAIPRAAVVGANVTVLPTLGGSTTMAADINDAGQVVGWSNTSDGRTHAFLWTPGSGMLDLGTLGGFHSRAVGINSAGQVTGYADLTGSQTSHAFLWTPGIGMEDLGTLPGGPYSYGRAIDDEGRVIGSSTVNGIGRAFLWTRERGMQDLAATFGVPGQAADLNNAGEITGTAEFNGQVHAFLWTPGVGTRDLGSLLGEPTVALAVNESGWVVGRTSGDPPSATAFLWTARDGLRNLGTLGGAGRGNIASDVNDLGQVVGESYTATFERHGFVWTEADGMEDIFPLTGLTSVSAINNRGQVVFADRVATLQFRPPVSPPEGAFTTGSGFYDLSGRGKAKTHFTFAVKTLPNRTTPNGNAKLWIPGGQLDFESTAIEMLVVSGNRAQFWGAGTLNGAVARFRITAVDGGRGADAVRFELWNAAGTSVLYDTQPGTAQSAPITTLIEGGNIQVH